MKSFLKLSFVLLLLTTFGCSSGEDCFTPPKLFNFQFIDKVSGENLITNGTYTASQITVKDLDNDKNVIKFDFITENSSNILRLGYIGWETETINYSVAIAGKNIFGLHVEAKRNSYDCAYTDYINETIKDAEFQLDKTTGIYKILITTK